MMIVMVILVMEVYKMIKIDDKIIWTSPVTITQVNDIGECGYVTQLEGKVIDIYRTFFTKTLKAVIKLQNGNVYRIPVSRIK